MRKECVHGNDLSSCRYDRCQIDILRTALAESQERVRVQRQALENVAKNGCGCSARGDKDWHGNGCYFPAVVDALRFAPAPSAPKPEGERACVPCGNCGYVEGRPIKDCGHVGTDGCCEHPGNMTPECHGGACPMKPTAGGKP